MQNFISKHKRLLLILAPILICAIYITLCAVNLTQSIWFDESYGAYLTRFGFGDIWNLTATDVHPPLFYFLLKIWSTIFGNTDFSMRFMSVFFGAVAIFFAFLLIKRKFGAKSAVLAALFMAFSPYLIRYGQEMRMYTLATAIIMASSYVLSIAVDSKKRVFWILYGILVSLGMWTHYFTALVWLAHLAWLIYIYRKQIFQKNVIYAYITALAVYVPWMPHFIKQSTGIQGGFWIGEATFTTVADFFSNTFLYLNSSEVKSYLIPLVIIVLAILIIFIPKILKATKKSFRPALVFIVFLAVLPPAFLLLLSLPPFKPLFMDRYVIHSSAIFSLILGLILSKLPARHLSTWAVAIVIVATSVIGINNIYQLGSRNEANAKELFYKVVDESSEGEPIIAENEWVYYDAVFYSSDDHPVYFVDEIIDYRWGSHDPMRTKDFGKIMDINEFVEQHETFWWIGESDGKEDPEFPYSDVEVVQKFYTENRSGKTSYVAFELKML